MNLRNMLFALLLAVFAASGCIFSPDSGGEEPEDTGILPALTADEAVEAYQEIYVDLDFEQYLDLISHDFLWVPKDPLDESYGYDLEISRTEKMFTGVAGTDPARVDHTQVVISDITFETLKPQGIWTPTETNDPNFGAYPDSQYRTYEIDIRFNIQGDGYDYHVTGVVLFYVRTEEEGGKQVYKILGMKDQTNG